MANLVKNIDSTVEEEEVNYLISIGDCQVVGKLVKKFILETFRCEYDGQKIILNIEYKKIENSHDSK